MTSAIKVALVTGAGTGIGRAVSLGLAADGYHMVLAGRRLDPLNQVAIEIAGAGGSASAVVADVTNPDSTGKLFGLIQADCRRLDLLFNNAGASAAGPLEDLDLSEWQSVIDVNLTGAFLCTQGAFRLMKAQRPCGGRIINNGSLAATTPRPNSAAYTGASMGSPDLPRRRLWRGAGTISHAVKLTLATRKRPWGRTPLEALFKRTEPPELRRCSIWAMLQMPSDIWQVFPWMPMCCR